MKQFSYIFPNSDKYILAENFSHTETTMAFLRGLSYSQRKEHQQIFNELSLILSRYYYNHYSYNYDDFAIFTLGWIKVTSHYETTFCYAGYDFQYLIIDKMFIPQCKLDEVKNTKDYPIKILNLDFSNLIKRGLCN